ncbi:MAG: M48 family metallopeptidase [Desulfobacteraceae bacterium]|jgi:Zn-dependent protease with chaperone function
MFAVNGKWYDGNTSLQTTAELKLFDNGVVQIEDSRTGKVLFKQNQLTANISDRLADTQRFLTFPNGGAFETGDNLAIDRIVRKFNRKGWSQWIYFLESKKRYVLLAFVVVLCFMAAMVKYGIPFAADMISIYLPQAYYKLADQQTLKALDHMALKPSTLDSQTQKHVLDSFQHCIDTHRYLNITLIFKSGGPLGPNAFALPGGTIIFTDELVKLAQNDEELIAILAHEIGHVVHRHGMRRIMQDSLLSFAFMALTGDASGVSEIFLGLPVVLTELAYSREFERSADQYALDYLTSQNISSERFADILARIDEENRHLEGDDKKWHNYLSTHPSTLERIKGFRQHKN